MSQYPSYYVPPSQQPPTRGNDASRRAAIMLYVLGALGVLLGTCLAALVWSVDIRQVLEQKGMQASLKQLPPGMDAEQFLRITYTVVGVCGILFSGLLGILGMFVGRGNRPASIIALVLCVAATGWFILNCIVGIVTGVTGNPVMLMGAMMSAIPLILFGFTVVCLIQGLRGPRSTPGGFAVSQPYAPPPVSPAQTPTAPPPSGYGYGNYPPVQKPASGSDSSQQTENVRHPPLPPENPSE